MTKMLKHIAVLLLLANTLVALPQSSIVFSDSGLKPALEKAKRENKPVLLWCYATWCPHCKSMKADVFTNQAVAEYFNNTFICVAQDMEKGDGIQLNNEVKISSFPTFIFYDSNGTTIYRVEGELKSEAFIQEGRNALIPQRQLPFLKLMFENNISNSENCYEYVRALKKGGMDVSATVKQYFATQSDKQLLSEVNWRIISNGVSDINAREMQFVIHHQQEFSAIASSLRVKRKLDNLVKELLNPLVETNDTTNYHANRKLATQIHSYSTDSLIFNYDLKLAESTKDWSAYSKTAMQFTNTFARNNISQLNDIAGNFLNNIHNKKALIAAEQWAQRSLAIDPEYDTYLLCSRLYQKLDNIPDAIKMAEKAKELSAKYGWEGVEAEKLLKDLTQRSN